MMRSQPDLSSPRLHLTSLCEADQNAIFQLHSDAEVQYYLSRTKPTDQQASLAFIQKIKDGTRNQVWYYWALRAKQHSQDLIGTICLWQFNAERTQAELGYDLLPAYQKQGFMQEALETVMHFAKEQLKLKQVSATVNTENQASIRLLERNNFKWARKLEEEEKFSGEQGQEIDLYEFLW